MNNQNLLNIQIKTGIDIIHIPRVKACLEKYGLKFAKKILTQHEIQQCYVRDKLSPAKVASRFAVKEAASKALGCGISKIMGWHDVWVQKKSDSYKGISKVKLAEGNGLQSANTYGQELNDKPIMELSVGLISRLQNLLGLNILSVDLSISDEKEYSVANVVMLVTLP